MPDDSNASGIPDAHRSLAGMTAIISGALGDIGSATALRLARCGADVAIGDVRAAADAEPLLDTIRRSGVRAAYHQVDVTDADAVAAWIHAVEQALDVPSLIIVNAAIVTPATIRSLTPKQWSQELRVNLDGAFHLAQTAALRLLEVKRPGRIVFVGSWAGHAPHPHIPAYCTAKAGLRMLCKCMAVDLAADGILVNEVAPGYVDAGLSAQMWRRNPGARDQAAAHVPTHQLIDADDVAQQIAHLCDPHNRHMTGSVLLMDGGLSLVGPRRAKP